MIRTPLTELFLITAVVCASQSCKSQTTATAPPKDGPVKQATAPAKDGLVKQLVELTVAAHPSVGLDEMTAKLPKDEMAKRNQINLIDLALKENKSLTPD